MYTNNLCYSLSYSTLHACVDGTKFMQLILSYLALQLYSCSAINLANSSMSVCIFFKVCLISITSSCVSVMCSLLYYNLVRYSIYTRELTSNCRFLSFDSLSIWSSLLAKLSSACSNTHLVL